MSEKKVFEIPCCFGKLVVYEFLNDEEYREVAIDLEKPDGTGTQIAIIGTYELEPEHGIHTYVWDGDCEEAVWRHETKPDGEYCF